MTDPYVNANEFHGYITRGALGRWRVLIDGQGVMGYEMPIVCSAWSRERAVARAERWCRRQVRVAPDERFAFDPTSPSAGFETRRG
jgi:hypothetical protein